MRTPTHSNSLLKGKEIHADIEISHREGRVYAGPFLYRTASWTPDQAEQLASLLISTADKARKDTK